MIKRICIILFVSVLCFSENMNSVKIQAAQAEAAMEYEKAAELYLEIYRGSSGPEGMNALMRIASIFEMKGEYFKSLYYYEKIVKEAVEDNTKIAALLRICTILQDQKDYARMLAILEKESVVSKSISLEMKQGECLEYLQRNSEAIAFYENMLKRLSFDEMLIGRLAGLYELEGIFSEKLRMVAQKNSSASYFQAAILCEHAGDFSGCEQYMRKLAAHNPVYYLTKLAEILKKNNQLERASQIYRELLGIRGCPDRTLYELAELGCMIKDRKSAVMYAEKYLEKIQIPEATVLIRLFQSYRMYDEAVVIIEKLRKRSSNKFLLNNEMIRIACESRNYILITKEFAQITGSRISADIKQSMASFFETEVDETYLDSLFAAVEKGNKSPAVTDLLAILAITRKQYDTAFRLMILYCNEAGDQGNYFFNALNMRQLPFEAGCRAFLAEFERSPLRKTVSFSLAEHFFDENNYKKAEVQFQEALREYPPDDYIQQQCCWYLARILISKNDLKEAEAYLEKLTYPQLVRRKNTGEILILYLRGESELFQKRVNTPEFQSENNDLTLLLNFAALIFRGNSSEIVKFFNQTVSEYTGKFAVTLLIKEYAEGKFSENSGEYLQDYYGIFLRHYLRIEDNGWTDNILNQYKETEQYTLLQRRAALYYAEFAPAKACELFKNPQTAEEYQAFADALETLGRKEEADRVLLKLVTEFSDSPYSLQGRLKLKETQKHE